jgi:hypothetical protein
MHDKDSTLAATRKDLLKPQTSQIKNIPQQSSNAVIEGFWGGLKADPAVGKMAESLELSCQPWQQEPRPTEPPKRKHKGHAQPQRSRALAILDQIFSSGIPPASELSDKELLRLFHEQLKKLKIALHAHDRTVLRAAGRNK